jgi:hypothetical protein
MSGFIAQPIYEIEAYLPKLVLLFELDFTNWIVILMLIINESKSTRRATHPEETVHAKVLCLGLNLNHYHENCFSLILSRINDFNPIKLSVGREE